MVAVHVVGSYQVFAMPVFDMIETVLVKKLHFTPGHRIRLIARSAYVLATMFIAMTFPFFDGLLGFFGRFGFAPTTYFIPSIAWLILRKPNKFGLTWFINVFATVIGVLLMLASPIGGMRQIIHDVKSFKFYS
jgi:hypothetical protein